VSVYSTQLYLGQPGSGITTLYTVPSGNTVVVRDVELINTGSAAMSFGLIVRTSGGTQAQWASVSGVAVNSQYQWEGRVVMNPGDELILTTSEAGMQLIVSGYLLA
jgi:hypothetical protein